MSAIHAGSAWQTTRLRSAGVDGRSAAFAHSRHARRPGIVGPIAHCRTEWNRHASMVATPAGALQATHRFPCRRRRWQPAGAAPPTGTHAATSRLQEPPSMQSATSPVDTADPTGS